MRLKALTSGLSASLAVGFLADHALEGPPEMLGIWLLAIVGIAIEGVIHLRVLADTPPRLTTAIVTKP